MTRDELQTKWNRRRDEFRRLGAMVDGEKICEEFLAGLETLGVTAEPLTVAEAARLSGYSEGHLRRLVLSRKIRNAGRLGSPRIWASDLPLKIGHLHADALPTDIESPSKGQIVRSAVESERNHDAEES